VLNQFLKYNIVGIVNTLVGFIIIIVLMFAGLSPEVSNAIGYGIGAILSYYLNSKYTFESKSKDKKIILKFFLVLAIAYALNFLTLQSLLPLINPYFSQVISAIVYTLSSFFLMKFFVFRE